MPGLPQANVRNGIGALLITLILYAQVSYATTIRELVEVVDIGNLSISPDGQLVAFRTERASIERNTYQTIWFVQPVDGSSPPRRLGDGGEALRDTGGYARREPPKWSPDGKWLFYRAAIDGRIDVWRAATDGSRTEQITHDPANVRAFDLGVDGRSLRYSVGASRDEVASAEMAEYDNGIHLDGSVSLADGLFRSGFQEGRLATQRQDRSGEYRPLLADQADRWKLLNLSDGNVVSLAKDATTGGMAVVVEPNPGDERFSASVREPGGGRIAALRQGQSTVGEREAHPNLVALRTDGDRHPATCDASACISRVITAITWRPASDEVLFTTTSREAGFAQSIFRWNVLTGEVRRVADSVGELSDGNRLDPGACAATRAAMICVAASADQPPRLERVDLSNGQRHILFEPNQLLARDLAQAPRVRLIQWTDAQGIRYSGQFYPASRVDARPSPLFIAYYRCAGFLRGGMGDEWPLAVLAQQGIAALCVNGAPHVDDALVRYDQATGAIERIVQSLAKAREIDPSHVGLGGLSFGAEVSMWAAMYSDIPRAISISTPVASPSLWTFMGLWAGNNADRMQRFWQVGSPEQTAERWRKLSPAYDPARVKTPVLMQMSEQEFRVSLDYAVPMIKSRRADAYVFPNEPHQKFQPRHKLAVYQRNLDWFRFWLLDLADPDPAKASQYAHWREILDAQRHPSR
ncbi:Atxe2 family lasso peptide isopeptidase [Pseudoxanthomonas winnipegensis]|uniref:Atxe2 family lasso peptide isopeptidase n=1 Tax=Pseudoxanthomonas winnipegensis TaxID=2480810 RepID=A0A4V2HCZ5_9GAMM|nr:Atxe2 family lasso peptide isopeptidase [Pseudoxanthomonas winnipegensis]RZZ81610.1 Atxe2 family lasso peptide isopeptidase [Pseudoxanthomonas winnipegensis]TAA24723.1 Atxe2 family lasso peptide isopeptidase [Pseudoxanthomonas winnipegensis]TAA39975.1 Atxe2 family lasso peptide isopeptidase [Pseudoxanthomonas winnipegensis]TBV74602.1 Atxe2 family lasso peptide isopeptidase [Pseudoxanthomonas winnipegensis]